MDLIPPVSQSAARQTPVTRGVGLPRMKLFLFCFIFVCFLGPQAILWSQDVAAIKNKTKKQLVLSSVKGNCVFSSVFIGAA